MFSRSIIGDSWSVIDDSRVTLQVVASFTIVIHAHIFIVEATSVNTKVILPH